MEDLDRPIEPLIWGEIDDAWRMLSSMVLLAIFGVPMIAVGAHKLVKIGPTAKTRRSALWLLRVSLFLTAAGVVVGVARLASLDPVVEVIGIFCLVVFAVCMAALCVVGEELCRWARSAKLVRCWRRSFWVTLALPIALGALFIARASTGRDELLFAVLPIGLYWTTEVGFALTTTKRLFSADLVRSRSGTNRNS